MVKQTGTGTSLTFRRATAADVAALAAFAEQTFRETFSAQNTPENMDAYCAEAFATETMARTVADPSLDTLLACDERGIIVAYAQLRPDAPPEVAAPSPIELWRFYVASTHHGRGIAQRLMDEVVDAAQARGARTLWLGVWEHNLRAQAFYRKMGFVDVGAHTFVLGDDPQTDRVMARDLAG